LATLVRGFAETNIYQLTLLCLSSQCFRYSTENQADELFHLFLYDQTQIERLTAMAWGNSVLQHLPVEKSSMVPSLRRRKKALLSCPLTLKGRTWNALMPGPICTQSDALQLRLLGGPLMLFCVRSID